MIKINYESDFKLTEKAEDGFANVPFSFAYSSNSGTYTASYDGNKYTNCKPNEDGSVTVIFNNHGLGVGKLKVRREFFVPDGDFPDGVYNVVSNDTTDVILVEGKTEGFDVEETFRPPYVVSEGGLIPIEVVDSLDSEASDKALSARQGKVLNDTKQPLLTGDEFKTINGQSIMGEGNIELPKVDVINNLTDGGTDKALSAEQGKVLKGMIPAKVSELENDEGYITEIPEEYATKEDVDTAIENNKEVFVAAYGKTTYDEILKAYNARKNIVCYETSSVYVLSFFTGSMFYFASHYSDFYRLAYCTSTNKWYSQALQVSHSLTANEDNTATIEIKGKSATVPTKEYVDNLIIDTLNTEV